MPIAVCGSGGLGSFPCSSLTSAQLRDVVAKIRAQTAKPLNLNFFCHVTQRDAAVAQVRHGSRHIEEHLSECCPILYR